LSSNQVTLAAGTYEYELAHVFYFHSSISGGAIMWLYNASDTADIADTESIEARSYNTNSFVIIGTGKFTLASSKTIEARYRVTGSQANLGLGYALNLREECYGYLLLRKVA
jgi:hypothetical protein